MATLSYMTARVGGRLARGRNPEGVAFHKAATEAQAAVFYRGTDKTAFRTWRPLAATRDTAANLTGLRRLIF